jgi:hypothetical protein
MKGAKPGSALEAAVARAPVELEILECPVLILIDELYPIPGPVGTFFINNGEPQI